MQVAVVQMNSQADACANLANLALELAKASASGARLVVVPEMFLSMDGHRYQDIARHSSQWLEQLAQLCRDHQLWLVAGAMPMPGLHGDARVRSASIVINDLGEQVTRYDKIHLFDVDVADGQGSYRESARFQPGDEVVVVDTPVGKLGLSICYDIRFPELYRKLVDKGAELISVPAAFTYRTGQAHWEILLKARAIETQCYFLAANQCGWHDEKRQTWGHSMIVDPWGEVLSELGDEPGFSCASVDLERLKAVRSNMPISQHRRLV